MDGTQRAEAPPVERLQHQPVPLPPSLIDHFIHQDFHSYPIVHTEPGRITRQLWQHDDFFPEVGAVEQQIHYEGGHLIEGFYLHYDRTEDAERIATLEFLRVHHSLFRLMHRYVEPPWQRRYEIGTALLQQAEQLFHQLAVALQQPVTIALELGQFSVLKWALKNGFQPKPSHVELVQQILEHPQDFVIEPIHSNDKFVRDAGIFRKSIKGRDIRNTVRLHLKKVIPQ